MKIMLGFLPFVAFALASALGYSKLGLLAGALIAAASIVRDVIAPGRKPKMLEIGTFVLFSALAVFAWTVDMALSIALVRICVDGGLLLIVLMTIVIKKPFTLEYAKERVDASLWNNPSFLHTNMMVSAAWAVAFAVIVLADVALWRNVLSGRLITLIIVGALYAAIRFTTWYPRRNDKRMASQ